MILYRPVGFKELELIYDAGMRAFPARLPQQPVFYPVLDLEYARQVAADWNAESGQFAGYVTRFKVEDEYLGRFEKHTVRGTQHQEFWIPAEEVEEFNQHILGHITVLEGHFGEAFRGFVPDKFALQGKEAAVQFTELANAFLYKRMDFFLEIRRNHKAVFLNYPFWQKHEFKNPALKEKILKAIKEAWLTSFPEIPLPNPPAEPIDTQDPEDPGDEAVTPARRAEPPPVQHRTVPAKRIAPPSRMAPGDEEDSGSAIKPTREQVTPTKRTVPRSRMEPGDEEDSGSAMKPTREKDSRPRVYSTREQVTPTKRITPPSRVKSDDEQDSVSRGKVIRESVTPAKRIEPPAWVPPDDEEESESVVHSIREERPLTKPIDSSSWIDSEDKEDSEPGIHFVRENRSLADEADSESWIEAEFEDIPPNEPVDSHGRPPVQLDSDDASLEEEAESQDDPDPVSAEVTLAEQAESPLERGVRLGLSGSYPEAVIELSRAVEQDTGSVVARTSLGVALHRLGEDGRALDCYEAVLKVDPKNAEAHYFRANILYNYGNVREAIAGYTTAIGLQPELIEAHAGPAPEDRLVDYNAVPAGMRWIAKTARNILDLNRALAANPRQVALYKERAADYSRLQNYEQASADYTAALRLEPEDASLLHLRGLAYEQLGQPERGLEDFRQAIAINPQLADEYLNRGIALGNMGNLRQSIDSLTEGIRLASQNPDGYFNRGVSYFQLGDFERAIADFTDVIRLAPADEAAYYWRGIANEEAGRRQEALADYRQFLELSQDAEARAEVERKLSQWNDGLRDLPGTALDLLRKLGRRMRSQFVVPYARQSTDQVQPEPSNPQMDLYDLISVLGERVLSSTWLGRDLDCYGEGAEELLARIGRDQPIAGQDFLRIAAGIQQIMAGDLWAFDSGATAHWIFIRAWEGNGFYVETDDLKSKARLMAHFPVVEEVEGAQPPYEGLFIALQFPPRPE